MTSTTAVFMKDTLLDGKPVRIECIDIEGQTYAMSRGPARVVRLEDEWHDDVRDPMLVVAALRQAAVGADIFTFWQRFPDNVPRFSFDTVWESLAVLPIHSFDQWLNRQIKPAVRNKVRKAQKSGVEVREAVFDDEFVRGMTEIFNETPIRQGRQFWHYGKDFAAVRQQFSRHLYREDVLGAYHDNELIGFAMIANHGRYGYLGQIISKIAHRDKAPNNALIAKAVEVCERRKLPHLVYANWGDGPLFEFKRANGFEEVRLPRYYVPITARGRLVARLGLHRGWKEILPQGVRERLKRIRTRWLDLTHA